MPLIPARIDAVTLAVRDVDKSARFYADVLGFEQVTDSEAVKGFDLGTIRLDLIDPNVLLEETHLDRFPKRAIGKTGPELGGQNSCCPF